MWAFVFPEDGTLVSATIGLFAMKKHLVKGRVEKDHNFMPNHSMLDKKVAKTTNLCDESIFSQFPPIDPQRVSCGCWRRFLFLILMARSYNDKWKSFSIIFYTQKIKIFLRQLLIRIHVVSRQLHLEVDVWAFIFPGDGTLVSTTIDLFTWLGFTIFKWSRSLKKNTNRIKIQHYGFEYGRRETTCDFIY